MSRILLVLVHLATALSFVANAQAQVVTGFSDRDRMRPNPLLVALGPHEARPYWAWGGRAYAIMSSVIGKDCHYHPAMPIDARWTRLAPATVEQALSRWQRLKSTEADGINVALVRVEQGTEMAVAYQAQEGGLALFTCIACNTPGCDSRNFSEPPLCATSACETGLRCGGLAKFLYLFEPYWFALKENLNVGLASCKVAMREIYMKQEEAERMQARAVDEKRAAQREQEQQARLAARQAEESAAAKAIEEKQQRIARLKADPKAWQIRLSADLCWLANRKKEALDAIAQEKAGARVSGFVNKQVMYDNGQIASKCDAQRKIKAAALKAWKLPALPCTNQIVAALTQCVQVNVEGEFVLSFFGSGRLPEHCDEKQYKDLQDLEE